MKELINSLHKAIEMAKTEAVCRKPDTDREAAYLFGYLQGKYVGLNESLKLIEKFLEAEDRKEDFK